MTFDIQRWYWRWAVLSLVLLAPFLRFLGVHDYSLLRWEAALAAAVFLALAAMMAVAARGAAFYITVLLLLAFLSLSRVQNYLASYLALPAIKTEWLFGGIAVAIGSVMYVMRSRVFPVLMLFITAALGVDGIQSWIRAHDAARDSGAARVFSSTAVDHVLYFIFDEHASPASLPSDIPECVSARGAVEETMRKYNFALYPFAFSNYRASRDSIPSIANRKMLPHTGYYLDTTGTQPWRGRILRENKLVEYFQSRGYLLYVVESDYIGLVPRGVPTVKTVVYKATSVGSIEHMDWPATVKSGVILGSYLQSDPFVWAHVRSLIPHGIVSQRQRMGPLAFADIWPDVIRDDVLRAERKTLFLIHLLTPHRPFIYDRHGRLRDRNTWDLQDPLTRDLARYRRRYAQYCEQTVHLMSQFDQFLSALRVHDLFNTVRIIVHGDHGSRIRLVNASVRDPEIGDTPRARRDERYDYLEVPDERDVLDRFATLFAVKHPHARMPARIDHMDSVMNLVWAAIGRTEQDPAPKEAANAYLFDEDGKPIAIPIGEIWRSR